MQKCLQGSRVCISVQAVNRKHSSYAFHSTESKGKKGFCGRLNGFFFLQLISNTIVFGCCHGDVFKCLFGRSVHSTEHDDCNSDFCTARGLDVSLIFFTGVVWREESLLCCFLSCLTNPPSTLSRRVFLYSGKQLDWHVDTYTAVQTDTRSTAILKPLHDKSSTLRRVLQHTAPASSFDSLMWIWLVPCGFLLCFCLF